MVQRNSPKGNIKYIEMNKNKPHHIFMEWS